MDGLSCTSFDDKIDLTMMKMQMKASEILQNCPKRPLIALDLDYTVR